MKNNTLDQTNKKPTISMSKTQKPRITNSITITAKEFIDYDDYFTDKDIDPSTQYTSVSFGIINPVLPNGQPLSPNNPDKFIVTAHNLATAKQEFWNRWQIYRQHRFPNTFVKLSISQ
jgi:hypothetical protein